MKNKYLILLTLMFNFIFAGNAFAYTSSHFTHYYPNDGQENTFWSGEKGKSYGNLMGYTSATQTSLNALAGYNSASTATIWAFYGHGRAGGTLWQNGTELMGKGGTNANGNYYLSSFTSELTDVAFMYFSGCNTANFDSVNGSLLDVAQSKGVDCVVGFSGTIYYPTGSTTTATGEASSGEGVWANYFNQYLWYYLNSGDTINNAFYNAANKYYWKYGVYDGVNTSVRKGAGQGSVTPSNIVLKPAKAGY